MPSKMKIEIKKYSQNVGTLLECLRYAGVISNVEHDYNDGEDAKGHYSFTIYAPNCDIDQEVWASMNAKRMRSFMINAQDKPV